MKMELRDSHKIVDLDEYMAPQLEAAEAEREAARAEAEAKRAAEPTPDPIEFHELDPEAGESPAIAEPIEPETIAKLLYDVCTYLERYVSFSRSSQPTALALWCVYTHCWGRGQPYSFVPYILATSAEPVSGKTTLLDLASKIVYKPLLAADVSAALIGRTVADQTLLLDEIDNVYKGRDSDNEGAAMDLRAILNSGSKNTGSYQRLERGKEGKFEPRRWLTFGPKMLTGIGRTVPDTVKSRSIRIRLERARPDAQIERARDRFVERMAGPLRGRIAKAALDIGQLPFIDDTPEALGSRDQDIWEPLFALADRAGSAWSSLARETALDLCKQEPYMSNGVRLLSDVRDLFEKACWPDRMETKDIIGVSAESWGGLSTTTEATGLCAVDDFAWSAYFRGRPITAAAIGKLLGEFDVKSSRETISMHPHRYGPNGYALAAFEDAWARYLDGSLSANGDKVSADVRKEALP